MSRIELRPQFGRISLKRMPEKSSKGINVIFRTNVIEH